MPGAAPAEFRGVFCCSGLLVIELEEQRGERRRKKDRRSGKEGTNFNSLVKLGTLYLAVDYSVAGHQVVTGCFTWGLAVHQDDEAPMPF